MFFLNRLNGQKSIPIRKVEICKRLWGAWKSTKVVYKMNMILLFPWILISQKFKPEFVPSRVTVFPFRGPLAQSTVAQADSGVAVVYPHNWHFESSQT